MIGEPDKPVRAITFGGGGVNAFMQLGAVHAALVARAKAPHVVLGVSMGAINATAFAEIMQTGGLTAPIGNTPAEQFADHQRREPLRVARFRQILDGYQRARDEILGALMPDTYQVEANRPLEALQLPGFAKAERCHVNQAIESRSGLMRLYNKLLELRVSVRIVTQVIRRLLAIRAAGALRQPLVRWYIRFDEIRRLWLLLGQHLSVAAPLFWSLSRASVPRKVADRSGEAGDLIFQSRIWRAIRYTTAFGTAYAILWAFWLSISVAGFFLPAAVLAIGWRHWHQRPLVPFEPIGRQLWVALAIYGLSFL